VSSEDWADRGIGVGESPTYRLCRHSMVEAKHPAELFLEDSILLAQIFNRGLLVLVDPARDLTAILGSCKATSQIGAGVESSAIWPRPSFRTLRGAPLTRPKLHRMGLL
jgi:hypothetical protein